MYMEINQNFAGIGTGILLHYAGQEFVATAFHVADECDFNPAIDCNGTWMNSTWKTIGMDEKNDIAILQRVGAEDSQLARLSAMYGMGGATLGAIGAALGFPDTLEPIEWMRWQEDLRPSPIGVPLLINFNFAPGDTHYSGGYLNHGFSGGPVVAWSGTNSTIIGIITKKSLTKTTYGKETRLEHAGLVGFTGIQVVERLLANHMNHDIQEIQRWKPQLSQDRASSQPPTSLVTSEIMDSVVRLGCVIK